MSLDILGIGLDPILHFEVIARLQGLKSAAKELGLSQPAVTHSLNKLESQLGVPLCVRSRSLFSLTEPGKRLFKVAQEIKVGLKGFQNFLGENKSFDGLLNIGILDNLHNRAFEVALDRTLAAFPKMRLNIQVYTANEIQNFVSIGEVDAGIGIFNKKQSHLTYAVIGGERICHYISERHPLWKKRQINREDLQGMRIAWNDMVSRNRHELEAEIFINGKVSSMEVGAYSNNLNAALFVLGSGSCVVPLPVEYLQSRKPSFKYRRIDDAFKPYTLKQEVVSRKDFSVASPAAKFFLDQFSR